MPPVTPEFAPPPKAADPRPDGLTVQVVATPDGLRALRPEWDRLYATAGGENPFTHWLWVWHWWQVFGRSKTFRRHRLHVYTLRSADGRLRGVVPLVLTVWGWLPLAVRALRLYGFREITSELCAPLIWPGWEARAAAAAAEALRAQARLYDWCVLDGLLVGEPFTEWLRAHVPDASWETPNSACVLPLPPTWEALRARLSRSMKDNLSYYDKRLRRDGHSWRFESIGDPDALPEALDEFFRLHTARSAMPDAPIHPDHYRSAESRRFLCDAAPILAAAGRLRLCRLWVDDHVAATQIVLVTEHSLYLSYSGFDPAWRRYSVMTLLAAGCIKQAIAEGRRTVNLSTWPTANKLRWRPQEVVFQSVRLFAPRPRASWASGLHRAGLAARDLSRRWRPPPRA